MKFGLILFAVIQSLWSIEAGILSFRYVVGWNSFLTFLACLALCVFDLALYCYLAEKINRILSRLSYFKNWLEKTQSQNSSWIIYCYRWQYLGLFVTGFIPHLALAGIAAQKIFRFKNGYWWLLMGSTAKISAIIYGLKFIEYLAK
ncbi:MAG: hypothetical protein COS58_02420 [Candidatus Tagabacteria bacterium CG03_land_8_20_14_0_80_41_22]|uniref:Uncharacterized protein n=1 Tax=Candidatus Tagabacteria bacterium CG03_land_8_20_14_0_80_41_22 TaxID=1975020 RepID=A0A2M7B8L6_9BACT|nr:MAG: hypothetical protein COV90_01655 [Candidatus Tagabacteria bacterium CG11_big_fil_rev_8_21_14_0_20_41_11]PIU99456.1 MAG: hypothetical protein COS58_02420 [Candidatus Tagabacteria bacterium CG03_land_8_20_14_0_80_41_22]